MHCSSSKKERKMNGLDGVDSTGEGLVASRIVQMDAQILKHCLEQ